MSTEPVTGPSVRAVPLRQAAAGGVLWTACSQGARQVLQLRPESP